MNIHQNQTNILQSNIVIVTNINTQVKADGVDVVITRGINYDYMKTYMEMRTSHVWGLKMEAGVFYPIEITLPIRRDLDGWVAISKSHVMFNEAGITNPYEYAQKRLVEALAAVYPQPIVENGLATLQAVTTS